MSNWDNKKTDDLANAFVSFKSKVQIKKFLRDLMTEQEIIEFGNRWEAAQMLYNSVSYSEIEKKTGLSSTTIARISKWLNSGMGGYKFVLNKLHHTPNKKSGGKPKPFHRP